MLLAELIAEYLRVNTRITKPATRDHYYRSCRQFSEHLGREAEVADLTDDNLAGWMLATVQEGLREATANQRAKQIRAVWAWAAKRRVVEQWPTVRGLAEPEPMPLAYSADEVRRLLGACRTTHGYVGPHRACDWWLSLHLFLWDTAERIGAALRLEREMVDLDAAVARVPARIRKGGRLSMSYRLRPGTVEAMRPLFAPLGYSTRVWEHHYTSDKTLYRAYRRLIERAGLRWSRRSSGFGKLRRTVLTEIELRGGNATAFARHSSRRVTEQSYLDQGRLAAEQSGVWPADPEAPAAVPFWRFWQRKKN